MPNDEKLEGNISLVGIEHLDDTEQAAIKKIVGGYIKRMSEAGTYKEMKLTIHAHPKGKRFMHEIEGLAFFNEGRFAARTQDWNPFNAVSETCEKILSELNHAVKKGQYKKTLR